MSPLGQASGTVTRRARAAGARAALSWSAASRAYSRTAVRSWPRWSSARIALWAVRLAPHAPSLPCSHTAAFLVRTQTLSCVVRSKSGVCPLVHGSIAPYLAPIFNYTEEARLVWRVASM